MTRTPAHVSRRDFLRASALAGGGLVLWFSSGRSPFRPSPSPRPKLLQPAGAPPRAGGGFGSSGIPKDVDAWLKIGQDGAVSLYTGKVEFGQGIQTAFGQLVADELDVPFGSVNVVMGSTDQVPYDNPTVGSQSMRSTGPLVRQAAAEMRQWLLELGCGQARRLDRCAERVHWFDQRGQSARSVRHFAALAAGKASGRQLNGQTPLKSPDQFTVIGTDVPRVDVPAKVTGTMKLRLRHDRARHAARQNRAAAFDGCSSAEHRLQPGQRNARCCGRLPGRGLRRACRPDLRSSRGGHPGGASHLAGARVSHHLRLDLRPAQEHARSGPRQQHRRCPGRSGADHPAAERDRARPVHCACFDRAGIGACRDPMAIRWRSGPRRRRRFSCGRAIANALQIPAENVTVHAVMSGGAFGRKAVPDAGIEAARLARGLRRPVRVNWTRDEEFQLDQFRPAMLIELNTGLDAAGNIAAWQYNLYAAAYYQPMGPGPMQASANASADATAIYGLKQRSDDVLSSPSRRCPSTTGATTARR